jgi:hypothetical protein
LFQGVKVAHELLRLGWRGPGWRERQLRKPAQRPYAGAPACIIGAGAPGDGYLPCNVPGRAFRYEQPDRDHPADDRVYYCPGHEAYAATIGMVPAEEDG